MRIYLKRFSLLPEEVKKLKKEFENNDNWSLFLDEVICQVVRFDIRIDGKDYQTFATSDKLMSLVHLIDEGLLDANFGYSGDITNEQFCQLVKLFKESGIGLPDLNGNFIAVSYLEVAREVDPSKRDPLESKRETFLRAIRKGASSHSPMKVEEAFTSSTTKNAVMTDVTVFTAFFAARFRAVKKLRQEGRKDWRRLVSLKKSWAYIPETTRGATYSFNKVFFALLELDNNLLEAAGLDPVRVYKLLSKVTISEEEDQEYLQFVDRIIDFLDRAPMEVQLAFI